jgi:hypothetical protein
MMLYCFVVKALTAGEDQLPQDKAKVARGSRPLEPERHVVAALRPFRIHLLLIMTRPNFLALGQAQAQPGANRG